MITPTAPRTVRLMYFRSLVFSVSEDVCSAGVRAFESWNM